jgi:hypothetical protein
MSVLWAYYMDYDLSSVATTTGHTVWIIIRICPQNRQLLFSVDHLYRLRRKNDQVLNAEEHRV